METKKLKKLRYVFTKDFLNDLFRKRLIISVVCVLIIIFSIFIYSFSVSTFSIVIGGSSSVNEVMTNLTEVYNKENNAEFTYTSLGSAAALSGIRNPSFSIGFLSKEIEEKDKEDLWTKEGIANFQFANEYILLIYHLPKDADQESELSFSSNDHDKILQKMYQEQIDWSSSLVKGVKIDNGSKPKFIGIAREPGSGTRDYFDKEIIKSRSIAYEQIVKSNGAMLNKVKQIPGSIGYISFSYLKQTINQGVKIAMVDDKLPYIKKDDDKYDFNNQYKFKRPFTGVLKKSNKNYLRSLQLIGWIISGTKSSKNIMIDDGLEPLTIDIAGADDKKTKWNMQLWNEFKKEFPDLVEKYKP